MGKLSMDLYLDNVIRKYQKANGREKGAILEELCAIRGYHKKHTIRLLNQRKQHKNETKSKRGRKERYSMEVYLEPLKLWITKRRYPQLFFTLTGFSSTYPAGSITIIF